MLKIHCQTLWVRQILVTCIIALIRSCSAQPDEKPGICKLDCGKPAIAGNEMNIQFLGFDGDAEELTLHCQGLEAGSPYFSEVPLRFRFERILRSAPTPKVPPIPSEGGSTSTSALPVPGISFEVAILSGSTTTNNPDDSSTKYKGILTSQSEWCTDSCGVGSIDILPQCQPNIHTVSVLVRSGNVGKVFSFKVDPN